MGKAFLIHLKVCAFAWGYEATMEPEHHDPAYYVAKAVEYRLKAQAAPEENQQIALATVALEFVQLAYERLRAAEAGLKH